MKAFIAFALLTGLEACNAPVSPVPLAPFVKPGNYQGNRLTRMSDGSLKKSIAQGTLTQNSNTYSLQLNGKENSPISPIVIHMVSTDQITISGGEINSATLVRENDQCFSVHDKIEIRLCAVAEEFVLEVAAEGAPILSLSMDWFDVQPPVPLEVPRAYTLEEAMDRALNQNFDTRMEFLRSLQAHRVAANAYLSLLPHLTLNSALALTKPADIQNLISNVGDLAPFLLPSRWTRAKNAELFSDAEKDALALMRGDTSVMIEAAAYGLQRDQKILASYRDLIPQMNGLMNELRYREEFGGDIPQGTSDSVNSVIDSLKNDQSALQLAQNEQNKFFSTSLGFYNPNAVSEILLPPFDLAEISNAKPLTEDEIVQFSELAQNSSLELNQMGSLLSAAEGLKQAVYFNWLDPSADTATQGLGIGTGEQLAIEQSKIDEIRAREEQIRATLQMNTQIAAARLNQVISLYGNAVKDLNLQEQRVARTLYQLEYDKTVNLLDLSNVFQDRLKAQIILQNAIASYQIAKVRIKRFQLEGYYSHLVLGSIQPKPSRLAIVK